MTSSVEQELLDIVDQNDKVIGVATRAEIHAKRLMHRAVHILVFNHRGEFFMQKRSKNKDENPGLWDTSAAGHVDSGECYDDCVIRELEEELGIVLEHAPQRLFMISPCERNGMEYSVIYRCIFNGEPRLQVEEIDEGLWLTPELVDQRVANNDAEITTGFMDIWRQYRSQQF